MPSIKSLDANGNGQMTFSIDKSNQRWTKGAVHVQVTDAKIDD